ncbi:MAG TPA: hypothetical protein VHN14_21215 [Kofleriaceae bacterium]|nr:hypothetical protein [Kofleriaceae bacterium]
MKARAEDVAGIVLAGGWLVAFTIMAGIANRVRPYRLRAASGKLMPPHGTYAANHG